MEYYLDAMEHHGLKGALQTVVLHGVQVVLHAYQSPLVLGVLVLVAGPDLLKVGHNVVTSLNDHLNRCTGGLDEVTDRVVPHLEDLLTIDAPDVVPLLQPRGLSRAVGLDPCPS